MRSTKVRGTPLTTATAAGSMPLRSIVRTVSTRRRTHGPGRGPSDRDCRSLLWDTSHAAGWAVPGTARDEAAAGSGSAGRPGTAGAWRRPPQQPPGVAQEPPLRPPRRPAPGTARRLLRARLTVAWLGRLTAAKAGTDSARA